MICSLVPLIEPLVVLLLFCPPHELKCSFNPFSGCKHGTCHTIGGTRYRVSLFERLSFCIWYSSWWGMNYAEVLLHRFGIIGPDGGRGKGLCKGLEKLQAGLLATIFKTTPPDVDNSEDVGSLSKGKETSFPKLKKPDNVDITIELKGHKRWLKGGGYLAQKM
ncbi:hypothetical protein HN51_035481 [Arachis hypogaea]|nr:uncharacterized protein DS421_13g407580 [Arachis hypogaea]